MTVPKFLFQPDHIDGYGFNPIPIDIHVGIIKIPTEEIIDDFGINITNTIIIGTERKVLNWIQEPFAREFRRYGMLEESDSLLRRYEVKQSCTRIRRQSRDKKQS